MALAKANTCLSPTPFHFIHLSPFLRVRLDAIAVAFNMIRRDENASECELEGLISIATRRTWTKLRGWVIMNSCIIWTCSFLIKQAKAICYEEIFTLCS